ncbi:MAG: hypothetical protein K2M75_03550 [Clostridia bacterium]|nr:hypothetical protein [Clostridia bacterium]
MYAFIIPIAMVAIGIIITVVGASRRAKEAKKKQDAEKAMSLLDSKEDFKKFLDYDSSKSESRPQQRPQQVSAAQQQSTVYRSQPAQTTKQQMTAELQQRLVELKRRQAEINAGKANQTVTSTSHHDSHCDTAHRDSSDKYRVEYVPTMNSIGGKSTEGCEDHYNVRYVKINEEEDRQLELTALQKAIVYGEVINQPAFKRQYRGR